YLRGGTTFWVCSPSPSIQSFTVSPGLSQPGVSHFGGLWPSATPGGVPVVMMSPGSMTKNCEQYQTMYGTLKIIVLVEPSCRVSPLTVSFIFRFCVSLISSRVTSHGPMGPKLSQPLPFIHWPERLAWKTRSETSLQMQ